MEKVLNKFNQVISYILLVSGMLFTTFQTLILIWEIGKGFFYRIRDNGLDYAPEYFKPVALLFFNVLLLLEILETIKVFDKTHEEKIRIILIVCLVAVSRKVLVMDTHQSDPVAELSVAVLILVFSVSYFLVRKKLVNTV